MLAVPTSIVEAARVDGAGLVRAFLSIVVPISRNSLITVGLFAFLFAWSDFIFALTLTTEGIITPVTLGIYTYLGAHISNWSAVMATAMLASIPAIILLVIAQKYIAAGPAVPSTPSLSATAARPTPKESHARKPVPPDPRSRLGGEPARADRASRCRHLSRRHAQHHRRGDL